MNHSYHVAWREMKGNTGMKCLRKDRATVCSQNSSNLLWQSVCKSGSLLEEGKTFLIKDIPSFDDSRGKHSLMHWAKVSSRYSSGTRFFLSTDLLFCSPLDIFFLTVVMLLRR